MLILYLSLFHISRRFRIIIYACCGAVAAYFVAFLVLFMTQCHPVSYGWNPVPGGGCRDVRVQQISSITASILLDFVIAVLPIPVLWNLQMRPRNKNTVAAMFLMGLSVVAVLAWRLRLTVDPLREPDMSREIARTALPSGLELWLSIIVVSLPALAPLFRRYIEPLFAQGSAPEGGRQLREPEHTIGSTPRKHSNGDILLESLPESNHSTIALVAPDSGYTVAVRGG
jgi:hypothetical protein